MPLARIKMWLLTMAVLAAGAPAAQAQNWTPFGPSNIRYDLDLFAPPDLSAYADWPRPKEGFFFQYERLYWSIQQPTRTEIGVPGGSALGFFAGSFVFDPSQQPASLELTAYTNGLDTGFLSADQTWGNRFELGFMEDDKGWFVSIMNLQDQDQTFSFVDPATPAGIAVVFRDPSSLLLGFVDINGDGFDDDVNLTGPITPFNRVPAVFGRPIDQGGGPVNLDVDNDGVPDAFAGFTDFGDLVLLAPIFDTVTVQNITSMTGIEINRSWRYPITHRGGVWEMFLGVRWLQLHDRFDVTALGGILADSFWNTSIDNNMFGPQLGLKYSHAQARFNIMAEMRFLAAVNFQSIHQVGVIGDQLDPLSVDVQNLPLNLVRTAFQNWQYDETFAPVGELRVNVAYQLTKAISVFAGYSGILGGGVSRASRRVDYVLPAIKILDDNKNDAWFTNGLNLGISVNR